MKVLPLALLICSLLAPLTGQRPKTVEAAITGFEKVREQAERNRHRAIKDLGRFAETDATTILIAELERAKTLSYQETVMRAIGAKQRTGALPALASMLSGADNPRIADAAAAAMQRQGPGPCHPRRCCARRTARRSTTHQRQRSPIGIARTRRAQG